MALARRAVGQCPRYVVVPRLNPRITHCNANTTTSLASQRTIGIAIVTMMKRSVLNSNVVALAISLAVRVLSNWIASDVRDGPDASRCHGNFHGATNHLTKIPSWFAAAAASRLS